MIRDKSIEKFVAAYEGKKVKRNKFNAVRTKLDGAMFDSIAESKYFAELKLMERAGLITNLERQMKFALVVEGSKICDINIDFSFQENGKWVVLDEKSRATMTPLAKVKFKLFRALFPHIELRFHGIKNPNT